MKLSCDTQPKEEKLLTFLVRKNKSVIFFLFQTLTQTLTSAIEKHQTNLRVSYRDDKEAPQQIQQHF